MFPVLPSQRCDEKSGLIAVTIGTSAAARIVLPMAGEGSPQTAAAATAEGAADAAAATDDLTFPVPKGLWCYRVDRHRAVLGGALTDGGSVFEWLRSTLALGAGDDRDTVMLEAERMPPASHGLVVRLSQVFRLRLADMRCFSAVGRRSEFCVLNGRCPGASRRVESRPAASRRAVEARLRCWCCSNQIVGASHVYPCRWGTIACRRAQ